MIKNVFTSLNSNIFLTCKQIASNNPLLSCNRNVFSIKPNDLSTIYALSSGSGKCGVSIIRISGPQTSLVLTKLVKRIPKPRHATLTKICFPDSNDLLDKGIVLWYPTPHSFTGEDCAELHIHGGIAVVKAVLHAVHSSSPCVRPADAGEFTKRSFRNGKMDLSEVEAVRDLLSSETESQRRLAIDQLDQSNSRVYREWRRLLIKAIGYLEAHIDFSESDDIENDIEDQVFDIVNSLMREISDHMTSAARCRMIKQGVKVTLVGRTNVGKSSLMNRICDDDRVSIVSSTAGTTRDALERRIDVAGFAVSVCDTAGLRSRGQRSGDLEGGGGEIEPDEGGICEIEREGIRRTIDRVASADIIVYMVDGATEAEIRESILDLIDTCGTSVNSKTEIYDDESSENVEITSKNDARLIVVNKIDLLTSTNAVEDVDQICRGLKSFAAELDDVPLVFVSCTKGTGFTNFTQTLESMVKKLCEQSSAETPCLTQQRHLVHLTRCRDSLAAYLVHRRGDDCIMAALHLRQAANQIAAITGDIVATEQILDVIFSEFCIGK